MMMECIKLDNNNPVLALAPTQMLPDDILAIILSHLPPCGLAVSCCVCMS